ncbi:MAG: hypothetical protein HOQ13_06265, partial [Dermatophilaceae bacterium]|nr:hypothetical protein [Dermatophilaceae bacterium]
MHLLIGLDEDDDRTLSASDAADGGDIDDVVEVLTAGGMRKAHHFVGVHWLPRTRIVAFGPVSALVTLADGSEHDVRAPSARVWTDLELTEHPERVVLRVLEESERSLPVPPQHLVAGVAADPAVGGAVAPGGPPPAASEATTPATTTAEPADGARMPADAGSPAGVDDSPAVDAQAPTTAATSTQAAPTVPTFGAAANAEGPVTPSRSAS